MDTKADILVHSPDDRLQLVVEVKNRAKGSAEWAAKLRRNLVAHGAMPPAKFFLLALPDSLYLWKDTWSPRELPPDYIARTADILERYLGRWATASTPMAEESLQLAVSSWLRDAASSPEPPQAGSEAHRILVDSGLLEAIREGEVVSDAVR